MSVFAGQYIFQAANFELEHNLQDLAFTAANAIELPIQEVREGRVQPEFIRELLTRLFSDAEQIHFTVFYPDGRLLIGSESEMPAKADRTNAPEVIDALESDIGRGVNIRENRQGEPYMYMAVLVQKEIEVIGILRLAVSTEQTRQAAGQALLTLILFAMLIASGVSLVGWFLAKNLASPIQLLTSAASKMEHGDLSVRVNPSGPDELRKLSEAFNSMASRLQSNVNELRAFVANASHELRTPLTVAKLHTEALRDGALDDHEVADRFLSEIDTEIDRLIRMVNDLLDLSRTEARLEPGNRTPVDLGAIAHEAYETFKIRASRARSGIKT